ncbi:zinc ribbon domain-containing protein [Robbsia sp. Bb-Pol-6]|uniref:Zinc ribbon domain-containing protein n=1 Tax=Robbsia betulipollinis TaxID=2981849 RepID=A0ABT3ZLA5_9BURK|nr:FmdB family zinc ribbon protein [Robbsia betulipollinis]MCY0387324.1 zinc ribbon domain-containing protein [Robbsia betulipollinis]
MPIYAYRCESCGFAKDVLRKISDPLLTECPQCGQSTFRKQVTAAGFQLKGSGWYVTDFREGGSNTAAKPAADAKGGAAEGSGTGGEAGGAKSSAEGGTKGSGGADGSASATPAAAPAAAAGSNASSAAKPAATPSPSSGNAGSSGT